MLSQLKLLRLIIEKKQKSVLNLHFVGRIVGDKNRYDAKSSYLYVSLKEIKNQYLIDYQYTWVSNK